MVPLSLGLIGASALIITQVAAHTWVAAGLTAATALITYRWQLNPLWMFAVAAVLGLVGAA